MNCGEWPGQNAVRACVEHQKALGRGGGKAAGDFVLYLTAQLRFERRRKKDLFLTFRLFRDDRGMGPREKKQAWRWKALYFKSLFLKKRERKTVPKEKTFLIVIVFLI